jgi:hypothetical protein
MLGELGCVEAWTGHSGHVILTHGRGRHINRRVRHRRSDRLRVEGRRFVRLRVEGRRFDRLRAEGRRFVRLRVGALESLGPPDRDEPARPPDLGRTSRDEDERQRQGSRSLQLGTAHSRALFASESPNPFQAPWGPLWMCEAGVR